MKDSEKTAEFSRSLFLVFHSQMFLKRKIQQICVQLEVNRPTYFSLQFELTKTSTDKYWAFCFKLPTIIPIYFKQAFNIMLKWASGILVVSYQRGIKTSTKFRLVHHMYFPYKIWSYNYIFKDNISLSDQVFLGDPSLTFVSKKSTLLSVCYTNL